MKMLCFKFHQNRPINEEFDFFEEGGRGLRGVRGPLFINFYLNYYWLICENVVLHMMNLTFRRAKLFLGALRGQIWI